MNNQTGKSGNRLQALFCLLAALCAVGLSAFMILTCRNDTRELNSLKRQADEITAHWKQVNDEKLELRKTLKNLENDITSANKDIEGLDGIPGKMARIDELKAEGEALQAQLDQLSQP